MGGETSGQGTMGDKREKKKAKMNLGRATGCKVGIERNNKKMGIQGKKREIKRCTPKKGGGSRGKRS